MTNSGEGQYSHPVVVGVAPGQLPVVVLHAAGFARRFGTELVCAHVNPARFATAEADDGSITSSSIDPDFADERETEFDAGLATTLSELLVDADVAWRPLVLAGDVTDALAHLGDTLDASMIVVGTHERSIGGSFQELFNRSIGVRLAHQQLRPVVLIPARAPGAATAQSGAGG
jgi:nucleotide-binding universal stress UspA family protein